MKISDYGWSMRHIPLGKAYNCEEMMLAFRTRYSYCNSHAIMIYYHGREICPVQISDCGFTWHCSYHEASFSFRTPIEFANALSLIVKERDRMLYK